MGEMQNEAIWAAEERRRTARKNEAIFPRYSGNFGFCETKPNRYLPFAHAMPFDFQGSPWSLENGFAGGGAEGLRFGDRCIWEKFKVL